MYSYIGMPSRGASGNSENALNILSSSDVMLMLFSLGRWTGGLELVTIVKTFSAIGVERRC